MTSIILVKSHTPWAVNYWCVVELLRFACQRYARCLRPRFLRGIHHHNLICLCCQEVVKATRYAWAGISMSHIRPTFCLHKEPFACLVRHWVLPWNTRHSCWSVWSSLRAAKFWTTLKTIAATYNSGLSIKVSSWRMPSNDTQAFRPRMGCAIHMSAQAKNELTAEHLHPIAHCYLPCNQSSCWTHALRLKRQDTMRNTDHDHENRIFFCSGAPKTTCWKIARAKQWWMRGVG